MHVLDITGLNRDQSIKTIKDLFLGLPYGEHQIHALNGDYDIKYHITIYRQDHDPDAYGPIDGLERAGFLLSQLEGFKPTGDLLFNFFDDQPHDPKASYDLPNWILVAHETVVGLHSHDYYQFLYD